MSCIIGLGLCYLLDKKVRCNVIPSNYIFDYYCGYMLKRVESKSFNKWMHDTNSKGKPRIIEFQLERCIGKLRSTHIYSDTIKIVKEMLAEEGMEGKFGNILSTQDFFIFSC